MSRRWLTLALAVLLAGTATASFGQAPKFGGVYHGYIPGDLQAALSMPHRVESCATFFGRDRSWTLRCQFDYNRF